LGNLIKYVDSKTYEDYILERYRKGIKSNNPEPEFKFNAPVFQKDVFKSLQSISSLASTHPARRLVGERKLSEFSDDLFLCPSFFKFTNTLVKNKFPSLGGDHPRLMIPFRDEKGEIFAYQGRAFGSETPKYITIKLDEDANKIFGLDKVDKSKPILVVEGPLDSLFLDNCVAMAGADFNNFEGDLTIVFDNEPRNNEICKQIEKTLKQGRRVVIWPDSMKHKDINDMIIAGYTKEQVQQIITDNTFSGASAQLRFAEWRKINA
jgi:hypothetical protein